jgi:hypothetical protein
MIFSRLVDLHRRSPRFCDADAARPTHAYQIHLYRATVLHDAAQMRSTLSAGAAISAVTRGCSAGNQKPSGSTIIPPSMTSCSARRSALASESILIWASGRHAWTARTASSWSDMATRKTSSRGAPPPLPGLAVLIFQPFAMAHYGIGSGHVCIFPVPSYLSSPVWLIAPQHNQAWPKIFELAVARWPCDNAACASGIWLLLLSHRARGTPSLGLA